MAYIARNEIDLRPVQGFNCAKLTRFAHMLRDNRERWSCGSYYTNSPNNWLFPIEGRKLRVAFHCHATVYDSNSDCCRTSLCVSFSPRVLILDPKDEVATVDGWLTVHNERYGLSGAIKKSFATLRHYPSSEPHTWTGFSKFDLLKNDFVLPPSAICT